MANRRLAAWLLGLGMAAPALTPALAQEAAPEDPPLLPDVSPDQPSDTPPEIDGFLPRREQPGVRPSVAPRAAPAAPAQSGVESIPGLRDQSFLIGRAPLRAEGTFLVRQPGSMVRLGTGERVFVFARDASGQAERPMVLLPSGTLARMDRLADERPETVFLLTGQVFVYRGLNYVLPTAYAIAAPDASPSPAADPAAPTSDPAPSEAQPAAPDNDPAVEDLIRALELQRSRPRTLDRAAAPEPPPDPNEAVALVPEDEFIVRRRGRMVRMRGGEWAFIFDSDADSAATDPTMVLSPSLNLQRMEAYAAKFGEAQTFELSGRVLAYGGRNFIIPTMFRVSVPSELRPMQ